MTIMGENDFQSHIHALTVSVCEREVSRTAFYSVRICLSCFVVMQIDE